VSILRELKAFVPGRIRMRVAKARDRFVTAMSPVPVYDHDGMRLYGKNTEAISDPAFREAYSRGMNSGHKISRAPGSNDDIHIEWRAHICCWAAWHAKQLKGDFVECGVNTGIMSITVCNFIDFNSLDKSFYLFDTFRGIPEEQMLPSEREARIAESSSYYEECFDLARKNFSPFPRAVLVRGLVPDTLSTVPIKDVCYLHLDMNIAFPEIAAIKHFWPKLVTGAPVLLDDYGFVNYPEQKHAMDEFAASKGARIASLPTGQGLLIKP
jgi:O-methyltransferase